MKLTATNRVYLLLVVFVFTIASTYGQKHYKLSKLNINSKYSDFGVSFINQDEIIFSSAIGFDGSSENLDENGSPFLSLYTAKVKDKTDIFDVIPQQKFIKTPHHTSNAVYTKDGSTVYFNANNMNLKSGKLINYSNKKSLIQLYSAAVDSLGNWSNIVKLPFNTNKAKTGHPALNADETKLYFVSTRKGGKGASDIYSVDILKEGSFGEPKNLGSTINTSGNEVFPFVDSATNTLYFSSTKHKNNLGGLDLYSISLNGNLENNELVHLKAPFNTYWDDFAYVTLPNQDWGYISSNRFTSEDNIYLFESVADETVAKEVVVEPVVKIIKEFTKNESGSIIIDMDPIYFNTDKFNINKDAAIKIEKIVSVLEKYKDLKIRIESHTDTRATDAYNLKLSERRAASTMDWLIKRGISASRLSVKAFGESQPLIKCTDASSCGETAHFVNRRTQFVVLNPEAAK